MALNLVTTRPFVANDCMPWKGMRRCALKANGTVFEYHDNAVKRWRIK